VLLDELARRLMSVSIWTGRFLDGHFERLGLTPAGARALLQLDPDRPLPTRNLAERLCCDPSNVTAFVDRLEESHLVERKVDPDDRRVKTLAVTRRGRALRAEMVRIIASQPPSLLSLSATEQRTLLDLLNKAWTACENHDRTARRPGAQPEATSPGPPDGGAA
jgi:DNA-binding MarR family transcriptional regulator